MKVFAVLLSVASVAVANIPYTEPGVHPGPGGAGRGPSDRASRSTAESCWMAPPPELLGVI